MIIITETLLNILAGAVVTAILKYICEPSTAAKNYMIFTFTVLFAAYILYLLQKMNKAH